MSKTRITFKCTSQEVALMQSFYDILTYPVEGLAEETDVVENYFTILDNVLIVGKEVVDYLEGEMERTEHRGYAGYKALLTYHADLEDVSKIIAGME